MTQVKIPDDQFLSLKLLVVLSKAIKVIFDKMSKAIKSNYKISDTEFAILELLYHKKRLTLKEIGNSIIITSGSITYNIDKLEQKGYLSRIPCNEDRRVIHAEITKKGTDLFDEIYPHHLITVHNLMQGLTDDEKNIAIELLKKLGLNAMNSKI